MDSHATKYWYFQTSCVIYFNGSDTSTYQIGERFWILLTIEDSTRHDILLGKDTKTPNDKLSSIPLQVRL